MTSSLFRAQARWQADWCRKLGSPFTALLCDLFAERLETRSAMGQRLDNWPGDVFADVLSLRLAGGLHARVRAGSAPRLAALYPPAPLPSPDALWAALEPALAAPALLPWLDSAPQTNEVARSAILMPGLMAVAIDTGLPLALLELGSSAGLNLVPDRYAYRLGGVHAGDPNSGLLLEPQWDGPDPRVAKLEIRSRAGVDLKPLDVSNPAHRTRMLAYVWPDQLARMERMVAAIAVTAEDLPEIVAGDAGDFVEARVEVAPGVATTVFHSIAFQYFPETVRERIVAHMEKVGATATAEAPLAWLRFEFDDPSAGEAPTLRLKLWPGGDDRLLARAHPHGAIVQWL